MPWRMHWEPSPRDNNLPVLKTLPSGLHEDAIGLLSYVRMREAYGTVDVHLHEYHWCHHCQGWIPGSYFACEVHDLGMLSGRDGIEYYCRRCGNEVDFIGAMA
jgi:hypothetical protein